MLRALGHFAWTDAERRAGCRPRLLKTPDEVSAIREAQRITEQAMDSAREALRPGMRQTELSGIFLRRLFELGATANAIDPIWQVMTPTKAAGPWTTHGDLAYPISTTDRILREGDVIWVDAGICHQGYASDFGRTWITSAAPATSPNARPRTSRAGARWWTAARDILKPGVSALELGRAAIAANDGVKPWMEHFYLAHGIGTDSAEMPLDRDRSGRGLRRYADHGPGHGPRLRAGHLGRGVRRLPLRGHRGGHRHRVGPAQRPPLRPLRGGGMNAGVMALEDGARVDFTRLRQERRRRLFDAMESARLDALVLGRPGNVRYAPGARQLWRTGANPFAPLCVVVRETGRVHLLSTWDDGIPPEIGHDDLYGMFWNPAHLIAALASIPGLTEAHRVGTDSLTPFFAQVLPDAGAHGSSWSTRRGSLARAAGEKTADELACIEVALTLAEAGLAALERPLGPGVTERDLLGVYVECVAAWARPRRRARAWSSPRRAAVPSATATWPATAPSARASWWSSPPAPSTPATRAGWPAPGPPAPPSAGSVGAGRPLPPGRSTPCSPPAARATRAPTSTGLGVDRRARGLCRPGLRHGPRHRSSADRLRPGCRRHPARGRRPQRPGLGERGRDRRVLRTRAGADGGRWAQKC